MVRSPKQPVKQLARDLGFALCGVCDARPSDHGDHFRGWLSDGKHGEMDWLGRNVEVRLDPRKLVAGAKSVVVVADALPNPKPETRKPNSGRIARYAHVTDYHKVMKKRLFKLADALREQHPDETFRVCVDTAPLLEREHAQRAGIGWTGKHTLTLNRDRGSHLLLGAVVTTLHIEPDEPATDHCGTCTRCIDACPTDAITPHSVDASRCISYLTIEHRSAINRKFYDAIGNWLYGCDICQDVCPFVRKAEAFSTTSPGREPGVVDGEEERAATERRDRPLPSPPPVGEGDEHPSALPTGYGWTFESLDLVEVMGWTEDDRRAAFRGSAMKRAKLPMMKRNAIIVAGNQLCEHEDADLRRAIERLATADDDAMVRQTARNVLGKLVR